MTGSTTFVDVARETLRGMFPAIVANDDYCSSVNEANFDRVVGLIDDARANGARVETVAPRGESLPDRTARKIAPTIVRDVDDRMKIASEEIFGPVLVVMPYAPARRRRRLHQRAAGTVGGVLVRAGRRATSAPSSPTPAVAEWREMTSPRR